jgi:hypothetical protein
MDTANGIKTATDNPATPLNFRLPLLARCETRRAAAVRIRMGRDVRNAATSARMDSAMCTKTSTNMIVLPDPLRSSERGLQDRLQAMVRTCHCSFTRTDLNLLIKRSIEILARVSALGGETI